MIQPVDWILALNPGHVSQPSADPDEPVCSDFQAIVPTLRVLQLNVEGLSAAKRTLTHSRDPAEIWLSLHTEK